MGLSYPFHQKRPDAMSSTESSGEQMSDSGVQLSRKSLPRRHVSNADSAIDIPEISFSEQPRLQLQSFVERYDRHEAFSAINIPKISLFEPPRPQLQSFLENYDRREAFFCGWGKRRPPFHSQNLSLYTEPYEIRVSEDKEIEGYNQGHKDIEKDIAKLLGILYSSKKYEGINEIASASARERYVEVYPARKPLPAGENVPWDISNGEERTQPRRRPRRRTSRNQAPASLLLASPNGIQIQNGSQNSILTTSSQRQLQVPEPIDSNLNLRQDREHSSVRSDESVTVTPTVILGGSQAYSPQRSSQNFDPLLSRTVPFPSPNPLSVYDIFTSAAVMNEAPRASAELPSQQLSTGQPDVISNEGSSHSANQHTPETSNKSSSRSNDTMTTLGESIESQFMTPPTPSIYVQGNSEPPASREPDISYNPVGPEEQVDSGSIVYLADNDHLSPQVGKEIPNEDPDPDWLRDYIHQHILLDPARE